MIPSIQTIAIVALSIAVLICAKSIYDLNKRINTMQRRYDSILYHNHETDKLLKSMIDILSQRCDTNHNICELLNQKCDFLAKNKNLK